MSTGFHFDRCAWRLCLCSGSLAVSLVEMAGASRAQALLVLPKLHPWRANSFLCTVPYRTVPVPRSSHHLEAPGTYIHHPKAKRMKCPRTMTAVALTPDPPSRHRQDAAHTRFAVQPPRELYPPSPGLVGYLDR
jgi:hypothetical protein